MASRTRNDTDGTDSRSTDDTRTEADGTDRQEGTESEAASRAPDHRCPACGGSVRTDDELGETVCADCDLVVDETVLDRRPPRVDEESEIRRTGPPTTLRLHDGGLGTVISGSGADADSSGSERKQRQLHRLRRWNKRSLTKSAGERSLQFGLGELERMASALTVPDGVRETASVVFRRAYEAGIQRGRSLEATATAALFAALRLEEVPVTLSALTDLSRVDHRNCERTYRDMVTELSLEIGPPDPAAHISRIASTLEIEPDHRRLARRLLEWAKSEGRHVGKHPVGQAAAALYAASLAREGDFTQAEIAAAGDVSTSTIRKNYEPMLDAWRDGRI